MENNKVYLNELEIKKRITEQKTSMQNVSLFTGMSRGWLWSVFDSHIPVAEGIAISIAYYLKCDVKDIIAPSKTEETPKVEVKTINTATLEALTRQNIKAVEGLADDVGGINKKLMDVTSILSKLYATVNEITKELKG